MRNIVLNAKRARYLLEAQFLTSTQRAVLEGAASSRGGGLSFSISDDLAEEFREAFNDRLMEVGFDDEYEPNEEGRILEDLIDQFFVGAMDR
ncbi:hypothetical protein [Xanthomonas sp. NCPPB 2632]|jgi:hypothetical protein|uniref:hypothetical protein n=1 Tax=Xanthomonas sp. NCPPB 2632 TaxID=3240912 RepID=UPI003513B236